VGIAAGLREKVELGDAIIGMDIIDYEGARLEPSGPLKRPNRIAPPRSILSDLQFYDGENERYHRRFAELVRGVVTSRLPKDGLPPSFAPRVRKAVVASGEKLIADGSLVTLRGEHDERVRAADMESHTFGKTCSDASPAVCWAVFRGISDFGEVNKTDEWQHVAALAASVMAVDFIQHDFRLSRVTSF
jgi:nucleoside phosphorylase